MKFSDIMFRIHRQKKFLTNPRISHSVIKNEGFSGLKALFCAPMHTTDSNIDVLGKAIKILAEKIDHQQPGYHPVYCFVDKFAGKRKSHLDRNCELVLKKLNSLNPKHQIRILDVGCNNGYVACRLAETFPNTVGIEIANDRVELCQLIAAYTGSSARFFNFDFIEFMKTGDDDLENVDVILLFNVVHQFIFSMGYRATQALLARMISRVDYAFIELAHKKDYVRHGKDHLLPESPEDVLAECLDHEIVLIAETPRPVFFIKRKKFSAGNRVIEIKEQLFGQSLNSNTSRKYYLSQQYFLKIFRFTEDQNSDSVHREVSSLLAMRDHNCVPDLLDWKVTPSYGWVLMERVHGNSLVSQCYGKKLSLEQRYKFTLEYLHIALVVLNSVGYHNDLQPHNFLINNQDNLVLIDFEQSFDYPRNDPFGLLLWTVYDIWGGRDPHRKEAIISLRLLFDGKNRAEDPIYPDFSTLELPSKIALMTSDALVARDWNVFLEYWCNEFSTEMKQVGAI